MFVKTRPRVLGERQRAAQILAPRDAVRDAARKSRHLGGLKSIGLPLEIGRGGEIRTPDPLLPKRFHNGEMSAQ